MAAADPTERFHPLVSHPSDVPCELLFIPVFGPDDDLGDVGDVDSALAGQWARAQARRAFSSRPYATLVTSVRNGWQAERICFVRVGPRDEADEGRWRRVAATCSYVARQLKVASCAWIVRAGVDVEMVAAAAADGLSAAEFDAGQHKSNVEEAPTEPPRVAIVVAPGIADQGPVAAAVTRGRLVGLAINTTRDLANTPSNDLPPAEFARRVVVLGQEAGLRVEVLGPDRLAELGMRLTLAVGQGSAVPPRLVVMTWEPEDAPAEPVIGLVGKGVTFDTGGISIKPSTDMDRMKGDMAGGAAVAAAMCAIARMACPVRVVAVIPMAENMPGSRAYRPGDVIIGPNGKSVEILNTDAEGRLLLADGLWYAGQRGATHLVDVATLTGHVVIGLGRTVGGLLGSPDDWRETVMAASVRGGDRLWPLPIYEEALEQLHSDVADMANVGGRPGGAITAAAFLREFTGDLPWAHLDIAGSAWAETAAPHQPKGPTGAGVRTLIEVVRGAAAGRDRTD